MDLDSPKASQGPLKGGPLKGIQGWPSAGIMRQVSKGEILGHRRSAWSNDRQLAEHVDIFLQICQDGEMG